MEVLNNILESIANNLISEINENKFIAPGHNGPYYDQETPVRNTAHAVMIFSSMYHLKKEKKYLDAAIIGGDYLTSKEAVPMSKTFYCRYNTKKDYSNGLIGTAWAIEALVEVYKISNNSIYLEKATDIFLNFPFDLNYGLWKIINVDGSIKGFDLTFNHQLWFAMSGLLLFRQTKNLIIKERCDIFFETLNNKFRVHKSGLIKHEIIIKKSKKDKLVFLFQQFSKLYNKIKYNKSLYYKENGYHTFNLHAFATIYRINPNLDIFSSVKFKKALFYTFSPTIVDNFEKGELRKNIEELKHLTQTKYNIYSYPYNAPGFEIPYIYYIFKNPFNLNKSELVNLVVSKQIDFTYDIQNTDFSKNTEDPITLTCRIYEYARIFLVDKDYE